MANSWTRSPAQTGCVCPSTRPEHFSQFVLSCLVVMSYMVIYFVTWWVCPSTKPNLLCSHILSWIVIYCIVVFSCFGSRGDDKIHHQATFNARTWCDKWWQWINLVWQRNPWHPTLRQSENLWIVRAPLMEIVQLLDRHANYLSDFNRWLRYRVTDR